jgi:hypothetical protein
MTPLPLKTIVTCIGLSIFYKQKRHPKISFIIKLYMGIWDHRLAKYICIKYGSLFYNCMNKHEGICKYVFLMFRRKYVEAALISQPTLMDQLTR